VCPQLADSTKIAEVHHKHNGLQMALHSESKNPEPQKSLKALKFQKVHFCEQVPMKLAKRLFGT
jgi:hypothetical protein